MSQTLISIGMIIIVLGAAFGLAYIIPLVPHILDDIMAFVKNFWWITIIIGIVVLIMGAWHEG
jgi:hypothetical protein